ncbi:MAG: hypothetical protein D4S01_05185 [Dehalococcoidia bacterium]|nr:MAG: hypothetical protein D4S01_05185 [Dehalococcoidia bacterium]
MKIRLLLIIGIILLVSFSAQAEETEPDYSYQAPLVPVPPQSVILNTENIQSAANNRDVDTEVTHYISASSVKEILRFYKRSLKNAGWDVLYEVNKGAQGLISFSKDKKDKVVTNITVADKGVEGSDVYVSVSQVLVEAAAAANTYSSNPCPSCMKNKQYIQTDPAYDASGQDPIWAPRYPGAIKRMHSKDKQSGRATVVYATDKPVEAIVKFYSEMMPNNGWRLKDNVKLGKISGFGAGNYQNLVFEGWQGNCVVSVNKPDDLSKFGPANQNLTAILLNFTPER